MQKALISRFFTISLNRGVFPIIAHYEIIVPHYGIITMIGGGGIVYLTTKLGGYNGKDPDHHLNCGCAFVVWFYGTGHDRILAII